MVTIAHLYCCYGHHCPSLLLLWSPLPISTVAMVTIAHLNCCYGHHYPSLLLLWSSLPISTVAMVTIAHLCCCYGHHCPSILLLQGGHDDKASCRSFVMNGYITSMTAWWPRGSSAQQRGHRRPPRGCPDLISNNDQFSWML